MEPRKDIDIGTVFVGEMVQIHALFLLTILALACLCTFTRGLDKRVAEEALKKNKARLDELHRVSKLHRSFQRIFDQYEYIELDSSTIIAEYGAKRQKELRFLHIPKTGTTLAATMVHYCCLMDGVYVNVLRQFNSIIPGHAVPKVCDMGCFGSQPRSPNGDPWAHIPFRTGIDTSHTIAMFRQPESRLASQLAYMQIIGPKLAMSFGFRRADAHILYHLLTYNYDYKLKLYLTAARTNNEKHLFPTVIRDGAYELSVNNSQHRSANYATGKYLSLAEECVKLQEKLKIQPTESTKLYNLSYSANIIQARLQQHFQADAEGLERFQQCGMRAAVNYPGLMGCQTRMVLGRNCYDSYTLTKRDVAEATRRVRKEFLFVGITERWEDSVRLFHKLHGGALHSDELVHQRSAKEAVRRTQEALMRVLKKEIGADPYDTALYAQAMSIWRSYDAL